MFRCSADLCEKEAKIGGMCVAHACANAKAQYQVHEQEQEMGSKTEVCEACRRELGEGERVYRGKCKGCREAARAEKETISPQRMGGGAPGRKGKANSSWR